jgi:hypothetical protein
MGIMLYTLLTGGFPWEEASDSPEMTSYHRYLATGELDFRDWFFPDQKTEHEVCCPDGALKTLAGACHMTCANVRRRWVSFCVGC